MTVEDRLARLEEEVGIAIGRDRPEEGTQFWMKGQSGPWAVWSATKKGISIINYRGEKVSHLWANFDCYIQDSGWVWKILESPEDDL